MHSKKVQTVSSFQLTTLPVQGTSGIQYSYITNTHLKIIRQDLKAFLADCIKIQQHALNKALQGFASTLAAHDNVNL